MALPKFTKAAFTDFVFSRGDLFPRHQPTHFHQISALSQGQIARVAELAAPTTHFILHFRLPAADYAALRTWLLNAAQGSLNTFTFTDVDTTAYTVRWWPGQNDPLFDMPQVSYGIYEGDIPLRMEAG